MRKFIYTFFFSFIFTFSFAQEEKEETIDYKNVSLTDVLKSLENKFNVKFSYKSDLLKDINFTFKKKSATLATVLFEISEITPIQFNKINSTYYYLNKKKTYKLDEVVVNSYLTNGILKKNNSSFKLIPKNQGILAGLAETDILESIQQLPGVVSINETATDLVVRGSSSDQNQIIWDNINIYHSGHLFGMVSVFNPNIANDITFYNKGTNVRFGERLASVIDIKTSDDIIENTNLEFGFNGINADFVFKTPLIKDKLSAQVSFRRSYKDIIETFTYERFEQKAFQHTRIDDDFFYFKDYNLKLNYLVNAKSSFYLSYIHIDNDLESDYSENDTNISHTDVLGSENDGYMIKWKYKWTNNIKQETFLSLSDYRSKYNFTTREDGSFISKFSKANDISDLLFSTEFNYFTKKFNTINWGYQANIKEVSFLFKEEKDILYILDYDKTKINTHSFFASYSFNQSEIFNIYSGFRVNYYSFLDSFKFEPRIIINTKLNKYLNFQITGEIKNQIISQIDETVLSEVSLDNKLWRLANNDKHPIINGRQITGGFTYKKNKWTFDFDLYYKTAKGITALSLGFLNPNDNTFHTGKQKVFGADFYLKKDFNNFKTWISYSFTEVDNKYEGINNNNYFPANTEINHALTTSFSYQINKLNFALGWNFRTGKPLTDLDFDDNNIAYFDGVNTEKLPNYHRLDFSSTYDFKFNKNGKTKARVGLSIRNIYNNKNHISTEFRGNNAIDDEIRIIEKHAIGITPNIVFRVYL